MPEQILSLFQMALEVACLDRPRLRQLLLPYQADVLIPNRYIQSLSFLLNNFLSATQVSFSSNDGSTVSPSLFLFFIPGLKYYLQP